MATGWAREGAVQEQIDATVKDAIERARSRLPDAQDGPAPTHCVQCGAPIPEARRAAVAGVRLCVPCQEASDRESTTFSGYNRRGSKDSQLR
jgi:phage/conjugal plasmid C-4 type zinc finger TraR family protein